MSSLNSISFSVDCLNLDPDFVFDPDQDLFYHHVFRDDDQTAGFDGFVVINYRNESGVMKDIIENVTHLLDKTDLFIVDNRVGVESRVQDMIQLLEIQQTNDVLLLVMWGMDGIGKTFNHCKNHF
ncbi:unnamed protein product [Trifolium pratense]|uniref:Uncharacterized protein n=1 Tax=Trifolium pratense TaxID=57577 RepID=A0ACB0KFH2_TRIPR|nr:unnamed protein product [Trifolium pratense]